MTDPRHLEARVVETKVDIGVALGGCAVFLIVSTYLLPGVAVLVPLFGAAAIVHYGRYRRAKRELDSFNKPPEARLLR